jgi:tRNA pseudouridine55 synthase
MAAIPSGILVVDKAAGKTSFSLVSLLRKLTGVRKIGHSGTLDPFATGVMVMLIGPAYTRMAEQLINHDKEYLATVHLGITTTTYDPEGEITSRSTLVPTLAEVEKAPMFSAKKIKGQKLYHLARRGLEVERPSVQVEIWAQLLAYEYPYLRLKVRCSKGTYIRSLAHDLGNILQTGAYLLALERSRSGPFTLEQAISQTRLQEEFSSLEPYLLKHLPASS